MARILGMIATSHTPTIGFAFDGKKQDDPVWKPIFEAYEPIKAWLKQKKPDVLFVIYNDHVTSFFFDHYSRVLLWASAKSTPWPMKAAARATCRRSRAWRPGAPHRRGV